jgi:peptidoglycan/LPS O-acetylase OafA/YrhL
MHPTTLAEPRVRYRPDIDGLRAVAVLLVLACHLGLAFPGGFVGVDVFFVISGYLITGTILPEIESGSFSLVQFYERRVRRILPALLVMLLVVTVVAYLVLLPLDLERYARSLIAALFSVSNVTFWREAGYFDTRSLAKPLLHTWSLAVEEQFYLLFPLFLMGLQRWFPKRLRTATVLLAVMSLGVSVYGVSRHPPAAYFLAPSRAWELLLGSLLSQGVGLAVHGRIARNAGAALGLLLIVGSALWFNATTPFPGWAALMPCVGAGLLIVAGEAGGSLVGSLLAWRPMVGIGLISYSLYLWHWPLIVFQHIGYQGEGPIRLPGVLPEAAIACMSLLAAGLSWRFVEQPFRTGRLRPRRGVLFAVNGCGVGGLAVAGVVLLSTHGAQGRFTAQEQRIAAYAGLESYAPFRYGTCFIGPESGYKEFRREECLAQHQGREAILLAGDSHAAQLRAGFLAAYPEDDILQATVFGSKSMRCVPVLEFKDAGTTGCDAFYRFLFTDFLLKHSVRTVVLSEQWTEQDLEPLGQTIAYLQAHRVAVVVVGPSIEFDTPLPGLIVKSLKAGRIDTVAAHRRTGLEDLDRRMDGIAATRWHVPYISVYRDLCTPQCPIYAAEDVPLLFDDNHFTAAASVLLVSKVRAEGQLP